MLTSATRSWARRATSAPAPSDGGGTGPGTDPADLIRRIVNEHLPPAEELGKEQDPTLALFAQWDEEDANMTPAEVAEENRRWEELKTSINAERDRAGARRAF